MSYHVQILRRETQTKYDEAGRPDFFESGGQLVPFTRDDLDELRSQLELRGYAEREVTSRGTIFAKEDVGAEALLTDSCLYLRGSGVDAVFEIGMFASEVASETFAKFDPQDGSWE